MAEPTSNDLPEAVAEMQRRLQGVILALSRIGPAIPAFREILRVADRYAPRNAAMVSSIRWVDETLDIVGRCFVELTELNRRLIGERT